VRKLNKVYLGFIDWLYDLTKGGVASNCQRTKCPTDCVCDSYQLTEDIL